MEILERENSSTIRVRYTIQQVNGVQISREDLAEVKNGLIQLLASVESGDKIQRYSLNHRSLVPIRNVPGLYWYKKEIVEAS